MKVDLMDDTETLIGDNDSRLIIISEWMINVRGHNVLIAKACGRDGKLNTHFSTLSSGEIRADYVVALDKDDARGVQ